MPGGPEGASPPAAATASSPLRPRQPLRANPRQASLSPRRAAAPRIRSRQKGIARGGGTEARTAGRPTPPGGRSPPLLSSRRDSSSSSQPAPRRHLPGYLRRRGGAGRPSDARRRPIGGRSALPQKKRGGGEERREGGQGAGPRRVTDGDRGPIGAALAKQEVLITPPPLFLRYVLKVGRDALQKL